MTHELLFGRVNPMIFFWVGVKKVCGGPATRRTKNKTEKQLACVAGEVDVHVQKARITLTGYSNKARV